MQTRSIPFISNEQPPITAAVLAGGMGTRLRSVVSDRPKVLALIHSRPCLAYLLDQLLDAQITHTILCTGYMGHQVESAFGSSYRGMRLTYSCEPRPMGTAGALRFALDKIDSETFLVMNGDSFCDAPIRDFTAWHFAQDAAISIYLTKVDDTSRFGTVHTDHDQRVTYFYEKTGVSIPGWINAGIYLINKNALLSIPKGRNVSLEHEVFPQNIPSGLYGYQGSGRFIDIGTPVSYAIAEKFFTAVPV